MQKLSNVIVIILAAIVIVGRAAFFILPEGRQAIITQFGKPVGEPIQRAGLKFKWPFIQDARILDKRILNWDGRPNQIPTKDKKYIYVDTTARWQIEDPLLFIRSLQDERRAISRIDTIIESATRDTISSHALVEAVRDSNNILDDIKKAEEKRRAAEAKGEVLDSIEDEVTGEIEIVKVGRERLSGRIVERASAELKKLGIKLIDVQLRRIAYEDSVEKKVYDRMISERQRIAAKIRSIGKGEQAKIRGKTSRDLQEIESGAYREVQAIKGKADAESTSIYATALGEDPQFFEFMRTLDLYRRSVQPQTQWIVSSETEFLRLLSSGQPSARK